MKPLTLVRTHWDRILATVLVVAGIVALLLGWHGASNTEFVAKQIPFIISGGLVGIVLSGVGVGLWISADLSDEVRVLASLSRQLDGAAATPVSAAPAHVAESGSANGHSSRSAARAAASTR